ncbi:MAG: transglycosylase domain-containing protein [Chthoniobacteraceae bacterium]|nr:transglycosylase domain-containing protein [Chthoniobacteraceae bacterium]
MKPPRWVRWAAGFGAVLAAWAGWFLYFAPLPAYLARNAELTTRYLDAKGRLIAEIPGAEARSHRPVPLSAMGPWMPEFTVALEDQHFKRHPGIDVRATVRAFFRRRGGGSTITEQYIKVASGRKGRSLWRKAWEKALAVQLERRWSKARILEAYLDRISYGNRLAGVEAASRAYFGKPAATLTKAEAAYLAGLPQSPVRCNPWTRPDEAARQFARSVRLLSVRGVLPQGELAPENPPLVERHLPQNLAPHFIQAVASEAPRNQARVFGVAHCTLDLDLQQRVQAMVQNHLNALRREDISQAAVVVLDHTTGAVRALVGSRNIAVGDGQINGALQYRNCGSTLKPFLYLTCIERRVFTAATLLPDTADAVREAFPGYDPHNFALSYLGPVRVRDALANSLNVPAVVALSRIGSRRAFVSMKEWGLRFDHPIEEAGAGFILGNVGTRLLDLTNAYAGLARGGLAGPPLLVAGPSPGWKRIASPEAVQIITDILCDNDARFRSFGAWSPLATPVRVGAKTGTSSDFRDGWAIGFTREHTVGVWVGNFDGHPMGHAASIEAAAPLWRMLIDALLEEDHPVPQPSLPRTRICALTGLLPCAASPGAMGELFLPGTEPKESAERWFGPDGHPLLPAEYTGWCASPENTLHATIQPDLSKLTILNPREGAVFLLNADLPASQQQLEMRVNLPEGAAWKLNGKPLAAPANGRLLWQLQEGAWVLEVGNSSANQLRHFSVKKADF